MEVDVNSGARTAWGTTHALDDLEEDDSQEAVNLGTLMVRAAHLGLHSSSESASSFQRTSNDENAREE